MTRPYRKWTEEQMNMLTEMFHAGCSVDEMGEVFQRPGYQIRFKLHQSGLLFSDRNTVRHDQEAFKRIMQLRTGQPSES